MAQHDDDESDDFDTEEAPLSERDLATLQKIEALFAWRREDARMVDLRRRSEPDNRFRVLRVHGRGGLGEVFIAVDEEFGRHVALKKVQDRYSANSESRARLVREAEIIGKLEHPGIVPVYSLSYDRDGRPYYAMRLIRGDSLSAAIERFHKGERSNSDFRHLLDRFRAVCNAIAYAHSCRIIHRDLKPANIMLGDFGETLVIDWGLAKQLGCDEGEEKIEDDDELIDAADTKQGAVMGTGPYMSPEQEAGKIDEVGPASDIYSLGATLHCLLTGQPPEKRAGAASATLVAGLKGKASEKDARLPSANKPMVSPALHAICLKAMAQNPEDRYASAQHLADDVERWLADEPVSAWAEPWTVRARRSIGRHLALLGATVLVVVLTSIVFGVSALLLKAAYDRELDAKNLALQREEEVREQKKEVERERDKAQKAKEAAEYYANSVLPLTGASAKDGTGELLYKLAAAYAASAKIVQRDQKLEQKERDRRFANYADRAVELLRRAKQISKLHLLNLTLDPDFDAIKGHKGFDLLLQN